jgi:hypothetical protein
VVWVIGGRIGEAMRWRVLAFVAALLASSGAAASANAAPTCNDVNGRTIKCGAPGAMPVGWKPAPEVEAARVAMDAPGPSTTQMLGLVLFVGGLMALIGLLPDFEGRDGSGWDPHEGDER